MSKKATKPSYTVEYALSFDDANPSSVLDKLDKVAIAIYNDVLGEGLKRLHKVQHDSAYASALAEYRKLCRKSNLSKGDIKLKAQLSRIMSDACTYYGFSEYALHSYVTLPRSHFLDVLGKPILGSGEAQKLATRAYGALYKLKVSAAKRVRFYSPKYDLISIEGKHPDTGVFFDRNELAIRYGKKNKFPIIIDRNDQYAMQALGDRVKYVRLKPRIIRDKKRWFAQLVFEGVPPQKNRVYGEAIPQGIDIGVSTIAVSTKNEAHLYELAPECATDERELRRIERKMDRSKRATNPDGTNKTGKREWKFSNNYKKLKAKRAEVYRKLAIKRKMSHETLANKIIASGTDIRVEKMQFRGLQKRSKKMTKKKDGRFNSKKRYGKTLSNRAPAMMLGIINRKLSYKNKQLKEVDTFIVKASQYNPLDETYRRKTLKERLDEVAEGIVVQRDMLSAFVIEHVEQDLRTINKQQCKQDFDRFKYLQDIEVNQLKEKGQLTWYIS